MERVLEGELARFEVPDVLTFLNMSRRTGALVMERVEQETKLFLREGNPVYATSTRPELRLGRMLVKTGRVAQEQLDQLLARTKAGALRLGQVLLSEQVLGEEELASVLKVQVSEVIFDTFVWGEGRFAFYDYVDPPATAVTLEMDLQNMIMEGVRRIDEKGRIDEVFSDLDMVVEAVANPERVKQSVTFTPEEWKVFFLVDGRRSLKEICRLAGVADELETLRILFNLMAAKFITVVSTSKSIEPTTAPPLPSPFTQVKAAEGGGTQKLMDGQPAPPVGSFSVEFSSPPMRVVDDDTKDVVRPDAVRYMARAQQATMSRLILVKDGVESSFPLVRESYTLGRHRNNDIVVNDPKVSGFHGRIDRSAEGFVLVDLNSRNGSYVNGKRVQTELLKTGDEIRVGTAKLIYRVDYTAAQSTT